MRWSSYLLIAGFAFSTRSAFACAVEDDSFNPPIFVIAFIVSLLAVSVLTFLIWGINRLFFRSAILFPAFFISTSLLALLLGILGTFVIPEFELLFINFGADVPIYTKVLFDARQFLWLPALLIFALWCMSKNSFHKTRYFAVALFVETNLLFLVLWTLYAPIFKLGCN